MGENVTVGESVGENVTVGSAVVGIAVVGAGLGAGVGENVLTESEVTDASSMLNRRPRPLASDSPP